MELHGTGTLITGASRGLGAALARQLARRGARLVLVAREAAALETLVAEIRAEGGEAHAIAADVGDKNAVYPLAGAAAALVGPLGLVVHNASSLGPLPMPPLLDTACEDLERVLAVNLVGPFRLTKAVAGGMAVNGGGLFVFLSSDAATSAYPNWGAYGVSKAALDHLARVWAAELEGTGVRTLIVDPGEMDTQMHADAVPDADRAALARPEAVARRLVRLLGDDSIPSGARVEAQKTTLGEASP
ncbi:MAG: SDR family oxidoreductase [Polyangiaceae bacterium]|jgi:NAD(P)-dependent dehydrogenase (short-subunit alcohol dehydrogenase family)|nr:SDR family oxidoreductase [Polyangiaceae bacterium]